MKIQVQKLLGDAQVSIYNKRGELIHTEFFSGKLLTGVYDREIPVAEIEYGHSTCCSSGEFTYKVSI